MRELQRPAIRIKNSVPQEAIRVGDNGRDDVHKLRKASDLDTIAIAEEGVDQAPDKQSILEIVNFLQEMGGFLPLPVDGIAACGAIPDVPLVETDPEVFRGTLATLDVVAHGRGFRDLAFHG